MKKRKLELYITGKLMSALMVGRPAIFSTGGEMYHTAPVVKIHETETQAMSTRMEDVPSEFAYGSGNSILLFVWNCQSYSFDNLIMRFSV